MSKSVIFKGSYGRMFGEILMKRADANKDKLSLSPNPNGKMLCNSIIVLLNPELIYMARITYEGRLDNGEYPLAFPGGAIDQSDKRCFDAVCREAREEVGLLVKSDRTGRYIEDRVFNHKKQRKEVKRFDFEEIALATYDECTRIYVWHTNGMLPHGYVAAKHEIDSIDTVPLQHLRVAETREAGRDWLGGVISELHETMWHGKRLQ